MRSKGQQHIAQGKRSDTLGNPERGYLWEFKIIIYEHLWLIDGHF